jgi:5-methylcytosine-specific restriction endonuclease McrA
MAGADGTPKQGVLELDSVRFSRCSGCGQDKPDDAFYACSKRRCKACRVAAARAYEAWKKATDPEGLRAEKARRARKAYRADPAAARAKNKTWRDANLEAARAMYARSYAKDGGKRQRCWRAANPGRAEANARDWRLRNLERVKAKQAEWRERCADAFAAARADWLRRNPEKGAVYAAKRRARLLNATPTWLSPAQQAEIEGFYLFARTFDLEVDHIVPLAGGIVCGLHVPWNMQVLSRVENARKNNR